VITKNKFNNNSNTWLPSSKIGVGVEPLPQRHRHILSKHSIVLVILCKRLRGRFLETYKVSKLGLQ
jgi:hypothetical protein